MESSSRLGIIRSEMRGLRLLVLAFLLGALAACGSMQRAPVDRSAPPGSSRAPAAVEREPAGKSLSTGHRVIEIARSLLAVPYRYAGSDPSGFDCSGFTEFVFGKVGLLLPRTAQSQAGAGRWVAPDELATGDLVFFGETREKPHHVGVVSSAPGEPLKMIHSSSSRGVIETAILSNSYWLPRLRFGRRVLPD